MSVEIHAKVPVGQMPDTREINFYEADPHLQFILARRLNPECLARALAELRELGARVGSEIEDLAAEADRNAPTLQARDKRGQLRNAIVPSRAYRELERILYGEYRLAGRSLNMPGLDETQGSPLLNDALCYLAQQAESGLFCPLGMTRSLARTLLKFAPAEVVESYLPRLASANVKELYTGAMFMTEKQSGSDLGIISSTASPSSQLQGWWELRGDKWFCSNAGADLILTLARHDGAPDGTRGLGLYLMPRCLPDGSLNGYRIERLKDKLGVRSFASGEVTLNGALALQIGGPGDGWRQMTEMLNTTRLACASAGAALARRSLLEAMTHARGRSAFGKPLSELPLMREQLLDMLVAVEGFTALFFEGSAQLAAADADDDQARAVVRVLMPLAKYHVSAEARHVVEEGMEVRGGNAYIEDWPNARLLRDVEVQAIWEGTGNISALDVGRALSGEGVADHFFGTYLDRLSRTADPQVRRAAALIASALTRCREALAQRDQARMRDLTRELARTVTAALLVEEADAQVAAGGGYRNLARTVRFLRRHVFLPPGGHARERDTMAGDWLEALIDWAPMPASAAGPLLDVLEGEAQ